MRNTKNTKKKLENLLPNKIGMVWHSLPSIFEQFLFNTFDLSYKQDRKFKTFSSFNLFLYINNILTKSTLFKWNIFSFRLIEKVIIKQPYLEKIFNFNSGLYNLLIKN